MLNQDLVGAGFAAVPAGGDQEQVKACSPTKGRLSRGLPNLATRTQLARRNPRSVPGFLHPGLRLCSGNPRHDFGDSSPNTSAPFNPAKRTSKMVREPSVLLEYTTELAPYLASRSTHLPSTVATTSLLCAKFTVACGLLVSQVTLYSPAASCFPFTEAE